MPMPTTVSVLLITIILVNTSVASVVWRKKSPHFRTRNNCKNISSGAGNLYEDKPHEGGRWRRVSHFSPKPRDTKDNMTFIENVPDYPLKKLMEILKKEGREHKDIFGIDSGTEKPAIHSRIQPQETKLCPSLEQVVYPKLALNKDDEWKYVVNVGEEYVQGVRVETCGHFDKCSLSESFPAGYTTACEQKYVFRRLLSVAEKGKPIVDEFRLPSCCSCTIRGPSQG